MSFNLSRSSLQRTRLLTIAFWLLACCASRLFGQSFTSSISGTITDPSGSGVPGAHAELRNTANNAVLNDVSNASGAYQFNNLQPGTYALTITAPGFKKYERANLVLQASVAATIDPPLQVGDVQQTVQVNDSTVLLDTQTANTSVTLNSQLLSDLPNATRNPLNFVFAIAGTTIAPGGQTQTTGTLDQMSSNFGINGGRTGEEMILIDGAPSQASDWGGLMVSPLQDSVQEQQIVTNTYDAQYERGGAGIVTLITKGGTNQFHGEAYDFLQNSALDANSWFNNKNGFDKGQFKQNQFGGNVSGPILKRANLFFFGGYEGLRQPNTQTTLTTVPTAAERQGDFSNTLNTNGDLAVIYNPFTTTAANNTTGYTRSAFSGNVIPSSLFDPVGVKMVNLFPLPNRVGEGPTQQNNYANQGAGNTLNDKLDTRVDWEQSAMHRLFIRWSDRFRQDQVVPCFFCNGADTGVNQTNTGYQIVLNDTVTPSPTWVINSYISYSRWVENHTAQGYGAANASTIGLSPALFQAPLLPTVGLDNGYSSLGNGYFEKFARTSETAQVNFTKILGSHTLKFGANADLQFINVLNEAAGSFNFASTQTSCDPDGSGGACDALPGGQSSQISGNAVASMLLGVGSGGSQAYNYEPALSFHTYGLYIQDQWRVNSRLTANFGVRYEDQRPATERLNQLTYFNPNIVNPISNQISPAYGVPLSQVLGGPVMGGFEYAGVNGNNRGLWPANNLDFAPRAGIAYKISDKLVARLGAGIFHLPPTAMLGDDGGLAFGFSAETDYQGTQQNGEVPLSPVSNPFPNGLNQPTGPSLGAMTLVGDGVSFGNGTWVKQPHPMPYTEQWSFNLQYQLGTRSVLEVGYMGNRGRKLLYGNPGLDLNQLPTSDLALGSTLLSSQVTNPFAGVALPNTYLGSTDTTLISYNQLLRPFPEYWALQLSRSYEGARSSYNALHVQYNHQFSGGLSLLSTYQWSKAMDNAPEDYFGWATGNQWRDFYNTRLDYNISTHDVPQSFATAVVYDLPYGRGKHWGNSAPAVVKEVLGNWQVSSVIRITSGLPLSQITDGGNPLGQYGFPGSLLPDWTSFSVKPSNSNADNWINAAAFSAPVFQTLNGDPNDLIYRYGNVPQRITQLRERASKNVDLSVAKNFGGEKYQLWLRGEALNVFNYAQYNNFCTDLTQENCPYFGAAQGTENQPRIIQLSLKLAF